MLTSVVNNPYEEYLLTEESSRWFPVVNGASVVKNNFHELDSPSKLQSCKSAVSHYLTNLLSASPPDHWFEDEEFQHLFEELKHLVGETSTAQGGGGRNLTLGNAVLLLGAASRGGQGDWLHSIHWTKLSDEILPKQTKNQSIAAIVSLMKLFKRISCSDNADKYLIMRVNLSERKLQIWLDRDCTDKSNNGSSLIELVTTLPCPSIKGGNYAMYQAYKDFMIESVISKDGSREARCVLNLKPVPGEDKHVMSRTLLELIPCK